MTRRGRRGEVAGTGSSGAGAGLIAGPLPMRGSYAPHLRKFSRASVKLNLPLGPPHTSSA